MSQWDTAAAVVSVVVGGSAILGMFWRLARIGTRIADQINTPTTKTFGEELVRVQTSTERLQLTTERLMGRFEQFAEESRIETRDIRRLLTSHISGSEKRMREVNEGFEQGGKILDAFRRRLDDDSD